MSIFTPRDDVVLKMTFDMNEDAHEGLDQNTELCKMQQQLEDLEGSSDDLILPSDDILIKKYLLNKKLIVETAKQYLVTAKTLLKNGKPVDGWLSDEAYDTILSSLIPSPDEYTSDEDSHDLFTSAHDVKCVVDHDGKRYACKVIATHVLDYDNEIFLKKIRKEPKLFVKYIRLELLEYL